jgi:hypothetical protein
MNEEQKEKSKVRQREVEMTKKNLARAIDWNDIIGRNTYRGILRQLEKEIEDERISRSHG